MTSPFSSPPSLPSPPPDSLLLPTSLSKPPPLPPPKKPAPLPWSHAETLALIHSYQEKWYTAKKGPLKSSQWEEISVTVAARCELDEPSRTSIQCRHKIEKLRKRYRSDLQKPYPNSWPYFELMDQLERGPMPLTAIAQAFPHMLANNSNNDVKYGYNCFRLGSAGYFDRNDKLAGGSDESGEEWNKGYDPSASKKNRSMSINHTGDNVSRLSGRRVATVSGKRKNTYYGDDDSDDDEEDEEDLDTEDWEDGSGEKELAAEIRGFAERFMLVENKKIEMMRETERYWMKMEKMRMDMILENHKKIMSSIGNAFGTRKKANIARET